MLQSAIISIEVFLTMHTSGLLFERRCQIKRQCVTLGTNTVQHGTTTYSYDLEPLTPQGQTDSLGIDFFCTNEPEVI